MERPDPATTFAALGDAVRRAIVDRLAEGDATVNDLAALFPISLQAVSKHVKVLEAAGVVSRYREGKTRPAHLEVARLASSVDWLEAHRRRLEFEICTPGRGAQEHGGANMSNKRTVTAHAGTQSISFSREFDAPAERVFAAHTDPALLARWTGPAGTALRMREFDARTGGCWSYVITGGGGEWAFHGSFHEVTAPSRLVQTFEFENEPGHPTLDVLTFVDLPAGRSRIDGLSLFVSVEDRDAMLGGMESGMDENFDRLDVLLELMTVAG